MPPLRITYVGKLRDRSELQDLSSLLGPSFVAQQTFEAALNGALEADPNVDLTTLTFLLGPTYPRRPLVRRRGNRSSNRREISYLNLPVAREITLSFSAAFEMIKDFLSTRLRPEIVLLATNYTPVTLCARIFASLTGSKLVMTLTDLTGFSYRQERVLKMPAWKRAIVVPYSRFAAFVEKSADAYVLFSAEMTDKVRIQNSPTLVMEGMYNPKELTFHGLPKLSRPIIAHAGTLDEQYGIRLLLDSFSVISDLEAELWLIGSGDMDAEILHRARADKRIRFFGFQPRAKVFQLLGQAKLLVNLRDPSDEFTKYSFPSKIFEYLATGVPVASTRLKGIPEEYFDYILGIDSLEPAAIAGRMSEILRSDLDHLHELGAKGRDFVVTKKTSEAQTLRVLHFLEGL